MEAFAVLFGLALLVAAALAPILSLVSFVRGRRAAERIDALEADVRDLTLRVAVLTRNQKAAAPAAAAAQPGAAPAVAATPVEPPAPAPDPTVELRAPEPAIPARAAAPLPQAPDGTVPALVSSPEPIPETPPVPSAAETPAAPPRPVLPPPLPTTPPPLPEAASAHEGRAAAPPPTRPPSATRPEAPPPPSGPAFDWESLLGVRGAAWVGAIAVVIAGLLFAKLAIDAGLFTPTLRVIVLVASGAGALIGAELSLRRGYETTANAVSGAGIALLYAGLFAGHALYGLIPTAAAFLCLAIVTAVAGLLAIRYDAFFTAVLGLLGGFATPVALSTGQDRPVGLFSYILLLNVGLLAVALRQRWHGLTLLALAGTFLIQLGWFTTHMGPGKMLVAVVAFLGFALLYLLLPEGSDDEDKPAALSGAAALGGLAPFLFVLMLAGDVRYAGDWPLLFLFVGLLDAALAAVALWRGRVVLLLGGALATAVMLPLWASQALTADELWGPVLGAIGLTVLLNLPPRLAGLFGTTEAEPRALELAAVVGLAGLGLFSAVVVGRDLASPPVFLLLLAAMTALLVERSGAQRLPGVMLLGASGLAVLAQLYFFQVARADTLLRDLPVPLLLALALATIAALRHAEGAEDEAAAVTASAVAFGGLFACLATRELGARPGPLLAAVAVLDVLLMQSAIRRTWTWLLLPSLIATALFVTAWQAAWLAPAAVTTVLAWSAVFVVGFLALPFLVRRFTPDWNERLSPWVVSALAGPVFLPVMQSTVRQTWGTDWIGALPLALAALAVAALAGVSQRFPDGPAGTPAAALRLRWLALFAAVALGLIAVAIPMQLDRQWITIGWALQGAAVWWLFGRLPHPGLRLFGALLFVMAGLRLVMVADVVQYAERGRPVVNWLLYTYGVPALSCLVGAALLRRAEERDDVPPSVVPFADGASLLGLLLLFLLINLEIADWFSVGPYVQLGVERGYARDLTTSVAWGIYALALLLVGMWREVRALRFLSLGFLLLTVAKVFLYDLSTLGGIYRILSFLGLGISLILVSLLYQRFVFRKAPAS